MSAGVGLLRSPLLTGSQINYIVYPTGTVLLVVSALWTYTVD
jgi:hypothetical protein